jgi:hypothetical protein
MIKTPMTRQHKKDYVQNKNILQLWKLLSEVEIMCPMDTS